MRGDDGVFVCVVGWDEFVEEPEELVDLLPGEVCVVGGVFYFEGVHVAAPSCHDIGKRVEAGVAYGNSDGVVAFLLKELNQYGFAVEASFSPAAESHSVNFGVIA